MEYGGGRGVLQDQLGTEQSASSSTSLAIARIATYLAEQTAHTHLKALARWHEARVEREEKGMERKKGERNEREGGREDGERGKEGRKHFLIILCVRDFHICSVV